MSACYYVQWEGRRDSGCENETFYLTYLWDTREKGSISFTTHFFPHPLNVVILCILTEKSFFSSSSTSSWEFKIRNWGKYFLNCYHNYTIVLTFYDNCWVSVVHGDVASWYWLMKWIFIVARNHHRWCYRCTHGNFVKKNDFSLKFPSGSNFL